MEASLLGSFERCCRLCAEEQDVTIMIFSDEAEEMLLQNKLNQYLLIEVDEDDKLPKNICLKCCSRLQTVCEFIDMARNAQEVLFNRSILLDQITVDECAGSLDTDIKTEPDTNSDDEGRFRGMEVSVDPMVVLQNSEEPLSPCDADMNITFEDVTHLHGLDGENVTIKLIRYADKVPDLDDGRRDFIRATGPKPFPCVTCKRGFYTELALKNHSWIHSKEEIAKMTTFRCHTCDHGFNFKSDLIEHLKTHKTNVVCPFCSRSFRTEKNLAAHLAVHLSPSKSYTCKVCGRSYNTLSNLKTHSITHSNDRPYHCHLCKKSFKRNQDLKFHINQHTGEKPYKCPFCDKCFASSGNCYSHRNRMHPGRSVVDARVRRRSGAELASAAIMPKLAARRPMAAIKGMFKYQCKFCDHSFVRKDNFTYHMYQHTGEKPFNCSFCTQKFVTRRGLLIHHEKEHPTRDRPLALISKNILLK